ncbi:MAG: Bug family tripartite tricarboxylate transporter substrate binding protein [Beijerinckiaceae bacterium]
MKKTAFLGAVAGGLLASICGLASARADDDFYKGKQINFVVASASGGGYDVIARMIGRHWPRYLKGEPAIIVQNMPGAGGIRAANWLYNVAPKDGLTIGMINNTIVFDPIYGNKQAQFDSRRFNWLGTPSQETGLLIVWHTVPVKNIEEARTRELIMGASGAGSTPAFFARVLSTLFDFKVKIIPGYKSQTDSFHAMEQGENDGNASPFWSSLKANYPHWLAEKKIRPLLYYGGVRDPEIPAPYALDLLKDPDSRAVLELAQAGLTMGRPILAPPGVDASKVDLMRKTLTELFADREFLAECKKQGLDCTSPLSGKQMTDFVEKIYQTPKSARDKIAEIYMLGQSK